MRLGAVLVALACSGVLLPGAARAQDRPGTDEDPTRRRRALTLPPVDAAKKTPPSPYDPTDEAPPPGATSPGPAPGAGAPGTEPAPAGEEREGATSEVEVEAHGRVRLELGWDTNVYRAESGKKADGFFHGQGEADVLLRFQGERELYANVTGEGSAYLHDRLANEAYSSIFVDYYHPLSSLFDVEVQDSFEYSSQNLLDDNGDLLPRAKFNAYEDEARAALITHLGAELSLETGGGGRWKHFEDTVSLPSLDYVEARGTVGARLKIPALEGKAKVRYVFRDRQYDVLRANDRDGTTPLNAPRLELQRHQVLASWSQKAEVLGTKLTLQVGYSFTSNNDVFETDRSYREHAGSIRAEWWVIPEWTRVDAEVRVGRRAFLVKRTLGTPAESLRQSYCDGSLVVWQKLFDHVALVGELGGYVYRSTDLRASYDRLVLELGVEGSF